MDFITKDDIRRVFIEAGFVIKEGEEDLKWYVYDAAWRILRLAREREETRLEQSRQQSSVKHQELINDLRSRINPAYSATLGTESYERRLCVEALESLIEQREKPDLPQKVLTEEEMRRIVREELSSYDRSWS